MIKKYQRPCQQFIKNSQLEDAATQLVHGTIATGNNNKIAVFTAAIKVEEIVLASIDSDDAVNFLYNFWNADAAVVSKKRTRLISQEID